MTGLLERTFHQLDELLPGRASKPGDNRSTAAPGPSPKFCIVGAGAIGGMIATLLAWSGAAVSVVARGQTLDALARDGTRLVIDRKTLQASVQVSDQPSELGVQDYVIVAVKAPSLPDIARRIGPLLGPETTVVTAMNGVPWWFFHNAEGALAGFQLKAIDPDGAIGRAIPAERVIGCVVYVAASGDRPGVVRHSSGRRLIVGELDHGLTPRLARLVNWLRCAGFDCRESLNIQREIWVKLQSNLCMNPISLLTTTTSDRIIGDPLVRRLCVSMMEEAARVGAAIGLPVSTPGEETIETIRSLGSFRMSMLQDLEHKRPVEIHALLTVVHDIGLSAGVPTPFIDGVLGLARLRATSLGLLARAANQ